MRILSIRGENLASLGGRFELDLERLGGLFVITGPTGAGKSTLLDAMCLALFDRVPRLDALAARKELPRVGGPDEDEKLRLSIGDVKSLLRRGAVEGMAEVDFQGRDGGRHRATWRVRRANRKPSGRILEQEVELRDLSAGEPGELFPGKKRETLQEIEGRLGLSYEQFRRSALLAQGDFASFLKADAAARAELLERMTGTELYTQLSIAAHERARSERDALARLEDAAEAIALLPAEERAALEAELHASTGRQATVEARLEAARGAAAWYETLASRRAEEQAAVERCERSARELSEAAPLQAELSEARRAQAVRAEVDAADRAAEAVAGTERELAARETALGQAGEDEAKAREGRVEAERARDVAALAEERAQAELAEAARLDAELAAAEQLAAAARTKAAQAVEIATRAELEVARLEERLREAEGEAAGARGWLVANAALEPLAREWARWRRELERYQTAAEKVRELEARRAGLLDAADTARGELGRAKREEAEARASLETAREEAAAAEEAERAVPAEELRREHQALGERRLRLSGLEALAAQAVEAFAQERAARAAEAEARAAAAREEEVARAAQAAEAQEAARLAEARRALEQAQAVRSLAEHRAELRDGEPCPLCGATEHPYVRGGAPLESLIGEQQRRVDELAGAQAALTRRRAEAFARGKALLERAEEEQRRAEWQVGVLAGLDEQWRAERGGESGVPEGPLAPGAAEAVRSARAEVERQLAEATAAAERAETLRREAEAARQRREALRGALDRAVESLREAEKRADAADFALQAVDAERERHQTARRQALDELRPAFEGRAGWRERLAAETGELLAGCEAEVKEWVLRQEALAKAEQALAERRPALEAVKPAAAERRREAAAAGLELRAREAEVEALRARRQGCLGGRAVEEARAALRRAHDDASRALEAAAAREAASAGAVAVARSRREDARRELDERQALRQEAETRRARALAAAGLELERVRGLLARGESWIAETEARLEALRATDAEARAVLRERSARREAHEAKDRPELPEEEAASALRVAQAETAAARDALGAIRHRLEADDQARRRLEAQQPAIEAQRARTELWSSLDELIGSSTGKTFKVFAQSLTLDALLYPANRYLQELARRYRLMRVPGHDLELQIVDQDMANEIRSVNSLSGGESFLVSLALALGLASLSSSETQVETLFIDEGFGMLDPSTLEVALATLDALQASGRQVGIISHVSGLAERIGVQVRVQKQGGGRSRLIVDGAVDSSPLAEAAIGEVA